MFFNKAKRFTRKIRDRANIVEKEHGSDSVPFCVLTAVYVASLWEDKTRRVAPSVESYCFLVYMGYRSMLSYYAHEVLNSDQREYIKQRELETLDIDNMYGRPVDLINGFFVKTGSVVFEAYSTLEKVEEQIKERIDFYITSDYSEELKIDVFNANLEKAKQSDCVCTFQTDLLSVSNIGLMGSLLGKEKFAAFGDVIVDLSKKMMSAYQVYYDDYKDG